MSEDSQTNSVFNAAANTKIHHAQLNDLPLSALRRLYKGGIRSGEVSRTRVQAQEMLEKIPPSQRAGVDCESANINAQNYLFDKHASHIKPHSKGGSNDQKNIKWENGKDNIVRGNKPMTKQEQIKLDAQWHIDNLTGAVKAGIKAAPLGAAIGAATAAPFSMLTNALRVVRGEISASEAALETVKDTVVGGAVGGVTAFTATTLAAACPPIAIALTAASPALLTVGSVGMVFEFFKILDRHQQEVRAFYQSLTEQQLERLQEIENELIYEHQKNLEFLAEAKAVNNEIQNRPVAPGIEGAVNRYIESVAIAQSLGLTSTDSKLIPGTKKDFLLPTQ